ncbi:phosphotransferase [Patescibacteria group bacterium]|nr:phosphotransferase [Patescibacteria group bacterium]
MRQEYKKDFLQSVLDNYLEIGKIKDFFLYTSGYENSNYYVETDNGKFVVKIFEGIGIVPENILFELGVMDYCSKAGLKTPYIINNSKNKLETVVADKYSVVMDYISGDNMSEKILADDLVVSVAEQAGRMDLLLKNFVDGSKTRQNYEWDLKNTFILKEYLKYLPEDFDKDVFTTILDDFKKYRNRFINLPTGLIHNDIVPHNWLVNNGKLQAIIDFSDMAFSPYIQNVAVSLHLTSFCYNWNPCQAKLFLEKYRSFNYLSTEELDFLYDLIKARFLSFVVEFNRWNVIYSVDKYRQKTVLDHYEFLKRFIDYGRDNFNKDILNR